MRCPYCKTPVPDQSINCPNCQRPLYETEGKPNKAFRIESIGELKWTYISYFDSKTNDIWHNAGYIYKENDNYIILLSSYSFSDNEEFSWVSHADFKIIPKKSIKEQYELKEA